MIPISFHPLSMTTLGIVIFSGLTLSGCKPQEKPVEIPMESFVIYTSKDTVMESENISELIPSPDRTISIEADKSVLDKAAMIADTLSSYYFDGLEIRITDTLRDQNNTVIYSIDLVDPASSDRDGEMTSPSWYQYFQGSYGGQHTSIVLAESLLQRNYTGPWMEKVIFYYQGEPMEALDHIDLSGIRIRRPLHPQ